MVAYIVFEILLRLGYCPILNFPDAAVLLGFPTVEAAYTARHRGKFPVYVDDKDSRLTVLLFDIACLISGELERPKDDI